PILADIRLSGPSSTDPTSVGELTKARNPIADPLPYPGVRGIDFSDDEILNPEVSWIHLRAADLRGVRLRYGKFDHVNLAGFFANSFFYKSSIVDSLVESFDDPFGVPKKRYPRFEFVDVSGTVIDWLDKIPEEDLAKISFDADWPPLRKVDYEYLTGVHEQ